VLQQFLLELGHIFLKALIRLEIGRERGAHCSKYVIASHVAFVELPVDCDCRVHRDAVHFCQQLILVKQHVVGRVHARRFE